jgi:hypothetical protein
MSTIVVKRQCNRCPRIDETVVSMAEVAAMAVNQTKEPAALKLFIDGDEAYEFQHLCQPCRAIVNEYLGMACRGVPHRSSTRQKEEEKPSSAQA